MTLPVRIVIIGPATPQRHALERVLKLFEKSVVAGAVLDDSALFAQEVVLVGERSERALWLTIGRLLAGYYRGWIAVVHQASGFEGLTGEGVLRLSPAVSLPQVLKALRAKPIPVRRETAKRVAAHQAETLSRIARGDHHAMPTFDALTRTLATGGGVIEAAAELETATTWMAQLPAFSSDTASIARMNDDLAFLRQLIAEPLALVSPEHLVEAKGRMARWTQAFVRCAIEAGQSNPSKDT